MTVIVMEMTALTSLVQNRVDGCEKELRHNLNTSFESNDGLAFSRCHGERVVFDATAAALSVILSSSSA